jgi:hypothetical protein
MSKINKKLSEALNIEPAEFEINPEPPLEPIQEILPVQDLTTTVEDDASFARSNIRGLIEKGNDAMDQLLRVAKESEHPRAYEVAATMIKNLADMNKELLDVQKKRRDLNTNHQDFAPGAKSLNVDKAVFVGSTNELVKFLKNNK